MITYITHIKFGDTARALDDRRLGHQRLEAWQVFDGLTMGREDRSEPVFRMWQGHEFALAVYGMILCNEWLHVRGCADKGFWKFCNAVRDMRNDDPGFTYEPPPWFGDRDVMRSHRSTLMRKQAEGLVTGRDYIKMFRGTPRSMPYIWPIITAPGEYELRVSRSDKALLDEGRRQLPADIRSRVVNL